MNVVIVIVKWVLILIVTIFLVWMIVKYYSFNIKEIFEKIKDKFHPKEKNEIDKQESIFLSEKILQNIIKEEIECMSKQMMHHFSQNLSTNKSELDKDIHYNRQLLERIIVLLEKKTVNPIETTCSIEKVVKYPIIKYARMIDNPSPIGFQAQSLSNICNGACYQIDILSDAQAVYRLITDSNLQEEIIAMFNPIITTGCEYDENPMVINRIIHLEDGQLELRSNVWNIVKKTKIKFI